MGKIVNHYGNFVCECGREFKKSQSLYAHQSHCKIHLGDRYKCEKHDINNRLKDSRNWSKGRTINDPIYGESIRKTTEAMKSAPNSGMLGHHHSEESKLKQSRTRKLKYKSGELSPAPGVGRGKYSYLEYDGKRILLRSTYEFIYALYLLFNNVKFDYESVRASFNNHTYIPDFRIGNKIVEIKGNHHADTSKARKAFESIGYIYEVKFWEDIKICYDYLKYKIDIDNILDSIKKGHDSRNYYVYRYPEDLNT